MPQEPKKRHSRQRQGKRRHAIRLVAPSVILCANCKNPTLPHVICRICGYYAGKQVLNIKKTNEKPS